MPNLAKYIFATVKWLCIAVGTVYVGFKWVQNEFRAIAKDEIKHVEAKMVQMRTLDLEHIDKRFDRIETLILRRDK